VFDPLNVFLVLREPDAVRRSFGWPDEAFVSTRGQLTKAEVRAVTLGRLELQPDGVLWDVGAGAGSVSIEASRLMPAGRVFAIERDEEHAKLIEENCAHFGAANVSIIRGSAPEALEGLPGPTSVFIGGSGGRLDRILDRVPRPFVANLALLEHLSLVLSRFPESEVTQLSVSRGAPIGEGHRLRALSPVWIVRVP
jgi:precorrin-6Y C5,15-methyltransferase (decarboxylating)